MLGSYVTGSSALAWSGSVAVPVSGTVIKANDVIEPIRTLADRTAKLSASLGGNFALSASITASFAGFNTTLTNLSNSVTTDIKNLYNWTSPERRSGRKSFPLTGFMTTSSSLGGPMTWVPEPGNLGCPTQNMAVSNAYLWLDLDVPRGVTLTSFTASINPATHGTLPANMPQFTLYYLSGTTRTSVGTQIDPSPDTTTYNAPHDVTQSLSHVVNHNYRFSLWVIGEYGSNSLAGLDFNEFILSWTEPTGTFGS